jgi:eukaryotic-like serine/threonine-protein kinase
MVAGLVAALVVGLAGGFFGARALGGDEVDPAKGPTLTYGRGGDIEQFEIGDGQCSSARIEAGRQYPSSSESDCAEPHEFEAIQADMFNNAELDHPGTDALRPYGEHLCALLFASDLVAAEDKDQALTYVTLVPTEGSWADAGDDDSENGGDRSTWCLITSRDTSQLEGPQLRQE